MNTRTGRRSNSGLAHRPLIRRGMALVWAALLMLVMIGFLGLATDWGYSALVGGQLHNAADAAALAGAQQLRSNPDAVISTAVSIAAQNFAGGSTVQLDSSSDVEVGTYDAATRTFTTSAELLYCSTDCCPPCPTTAPNAVRVTARRTAHSPGGSLPLFFGPVFGAPTIDITRTSIAVLGVSKIPGILVLNPTAPGAFSMSGSGNLVIMNGGIQVNSTSSTALSVNGSGDISADEVDVVGNYRINGSASITPHPQAGSSAVNDPLASLPAPSFPTGQAGLKITSNATVSPGYYTGGIDISGSGNVTLNPGIYILGGAGLRVTGSASVTGNGVMLYLTGTGALDLAGSGRLTLTPPDPSRNSFAGVSTYSGVTVFQDRADTSAATINGSESTTLSGTVYMPAAQATVTGDGTQLTVTLIVDRLTVNGSGWLSLDNTDMQASGNAYLVQ
jgi:Flp pilus assembly protein TadG